MSDVEDTSPVDIPGYTCIHKGKTCSKNGGLIIYLLKKFNFDVITDYNNTDAFEKQFIKVSGEFITKPIILGNIYRQPKTLLQNYVDFINEFTHILTDLEKQNFDVIIAGDYNIDLLKIREKYIFNDFFESIISTSFFPKITLPTRFSGQKGTLIDNFICKISETLLDSLSGILIKNFSDHQPYFLCLKTIKHKKPPTEIKLVKDQSALFTQIRRHKNNKHNR